jgi:hypothetical protein
LRGMNGCANAKTKKATAKHRAKSTSKLRNLRREELSSFTSLKKRTLVKYTVLNLLK